MTSELEGICTRREDRDKRKVELEELNQQDNKNNKFTNLAILFNLNSKRHLLKR